MTLWTGLHSKEVGLNVALQNLPGRRISHIFHNMFLERNCLAGMLIVYGTQLVYTEVVLLTKYVGVVLITVCLLKLLLNRPRPVWTDTTDLVYTLRDIQLDASFPSGHTAFLIAVSCVGALHDFGPVFISLTFSVAVIGGWTRIRAGAHYLSDIVAGAVLAAVLVTGMYAAGLPDAEGLEVTVITLSASILSTLMVWMIRRYDLLGFEMTQEEERQCMINLKAKMNEKREKELGKLQASWSDRSMKLFDVELPKFHAVPLAAGAAILTSIFWAPRPPTQEIGACGSASGASFAIAMVLFSVLLPKVLLTRWLSTDTLAYAFGVYVVYSGAFALTLRFSPDIAELSSEADCTGLWVAWVAIVVFAALITTAKKLRAKELPDEKYPFDTNRFRADTPMWKIMVCLVWMLAFGWWVGLIRFVAYVISHKLFGGHGEYTIFFLSCIRRPPGSGIWLCSHHASMDLSCMNGKLFVNKKIAYLPTTGSWYRKRRMIWSDFKNVFDKWTEGDLTLAPAGFSTAHGFTPGIPLQYISNPHICDRKIVEIKMTSPFNICQRVDGAHVLKDLFWCLSQPFLKIDVILVAEIPANTTPQITHESLKEAFDRVGVKYLPEWTVKHRYGKQSV